MRARASSKSSAPCLVLLLYTCPPTHHTYLSRQDGTQDSKEVSGMHSAAGIAVLLRSSS